MLKSLFFILFITNTLFANEQQIIKVIQKFNPRMSHVQAVVKAKIITQYSKEYHVNWKIVCAIFQQESNFRISAINIKSGDYGIGQLNYKNIEYRNINIRQLLNDPDYAIKHTLQFLSELKRSYKKKDGEVWYSRYHSFKDSHRQKYEKLINKWLQEIEDVIK